MKEALRDSEERLALALQASQEGVWDWNLETNAAWYSSRWREMLGYGESEIEPQRQLLGAFNPSGRQGAGHRDGGCGPPRQDGSSRWSAASGTETATTCDILSRGVGLRREAGGPVVRIVGTHFDLTDRKRAEEALRESVRRERLLAGILETSEQPFAIGYPDGRLGICNRAYCELTGYSLEELQSISWRAPLTPPEWIEKQMAALARARADRETGPL